MIKAIIIDDEKPARDLIKMFLKDHHDIEIVAEATNGFEGAKLINELNPELIFLDIQMPKINGLEMLELLENQPAVIFCTAYDDYAIKAFERNAIDYLLKPFAKERFKAALEKARIRVKSGAKVISLPEPLQYPGPIHRIVVKDRQEISIIDVNDILYLEAQDDYVEIHTKAGKWLKQQTMKYFEAALDDQEFTRIHRRFIVKLTVISKIDKLGKESYLAILRSGDRLQVSKSGYQKLKSQLGI